MTTLVLRLLAAIAALSILQGLLGTALLSGVQVEPGAATLGLLSAALIAATLFTLARRQPAGLARVVTLFAIWGGVQALALVEAWLFPLLIPPAMWWRLLAFQMLVSLAFAVVLDRVAGPGTDGPTAWPRERSAPSWLARVAAGTGGYIVAYFVAGLLVWPYIAHFYSTRPMPGHGSVLLMQVARGLGLTGIVALVVLRTAGNRRSAALLAGLTLSILGGVAPLIVPNPYMPVDIRIPHLFETGISNFLYGALAGFVLAAPASRTRMQGWPSPVSPSRSPSSAS
jgi:hypothetical protein